MDAKHSASKKVLHIACLHYTRQKQQLNYINKLLRIKYTSSNTTDQTSSKTISAYIQNICQSSIKQCSITENKISQNSVQQLNRYTIN